LRLENLEARKREGFRALFLAKSVLETATGSQAEQALIERRKVCMGSRQIGMGTSGKHLAEERRAWKRGAGQTASRGNFFMLQLSLTRGIRLFN